MAAQYQGKLVVQNYDTSPSSVAPTQGKLDGAIQAGETFEYFLNDYGPPVSNLRHEDGQPVLISECIPIESVPTDADIFISAGEGYYIQN